MTIWNRVLSSPTFTYPFVAVIVVVLVFLGFYLPLKSNQEETLNDRAFRTLAGAGDRLEGTVSSYSSALQALNRFGGLMTGWQ